MAHLKPNLPHKCCPVCQRNFVWRKKWQRCWAEVRYCSERCRSERSERSKPHGLDHGAC